MIPWIVLALGWCGAGVMWWLERRCRRHLAEAQRVLAQIHAAQNATRAIFGRGWKPRVDVDDHELDAEPYLRGPDD